MAEGNYPKISIVIPNLNNGQFLEEAILSVLEQNYSNIELIIVDGGSTDNSIEIIRKYDPYIAWWVSEPDQGQAHAINKGLENATGDIFDWLNSDDRIAPETFWKVTQTFESYPEAYVVCGYMTYFSIDKYSLPVRMSIFKRLEKTLVFGSLSGPSMYFRLDKFKALGKLEEGLHYCFDLEFWYRFVERYGTGRLQCIDDNLCFFRIHPQSKTGSGRVKFYEEQYLIHCTVIQSSGQVGLPIIPKKVLGIQKDYSRNWDFSKLSPSLFAAYAIHRHLDLFNVRMTSFSILKWYCISFFLAPFYRGWKFYLLPFRAINWRFHLFPMRDFPT